MSRIESSNIKECLEKIKVFKQKYNINLTDEEILNHYLEDVLLDNPSKYILNKDIVNVTTSTLNKEQILVDTLNQDKIFIYEAFGLKHDLKILKQMYLFREYAETYSNNNKIDLNINETYSDDTFSFKCNLIIEKKRLGKLSV